jgi:hypothetical protein
VDDSFRTSSSTCYTQAAQCSNWIEMNVSKTVQHPTLNPQMTLIFQSNQVVLTIFKMWFGSVQTDCVSMTRSNSVSYIAFAALEGIDFGTPNQRLQELICLNNCVLLEYAVKLGQRGDFIDSIMMLSLRGCVRVH